ncbi:MAG: hypothetical protein ACE5H2_05900 [Terriglobia bacterium]
MAKCPECGALLDIESDEVKEGEILPCPGCDVDLEVVNTNPLEFDVLEEEEEEEEERGKGIRESGEEESEKYGEGKH